MRSFKNFLVLGLMILLIGFTSDCKVIKNIFGPDIDDDEELKFATNVEIIYERTSPLGSTDDVHLNIYPIDGPEDWQPISNATMEKIADQQFKYVAKKLPADVKLYASVIDEGKPSGEEYTARKIIINGTELTDIRNDPSGHYEVAYFTIKEDGTVVP